MNVRSTSQCSVHVLKVVSFMFIFRVLCRRISGPHICGDSIDIDPVHDQILTGSWRKDNALQVSSL